MKKTAMLTLPAVALGALIAANWKDLVRYFKIEQMDHGTGHPENVPASGRIAYPQAEPPSGDQSRG